MMSQIQSELNHRQIRREISRKEVSQLFIILCWSSVEAHKSTHVHNPTRSSLAGI